MPPVSSMYQTSEDVAVMENSCGVGYRGGEGWYGAPGQRIEGGLDVVHLMGERPCRADRCNRATPRMWRGAG
jgi:hypothetical protein